MTEIVPDYSVIQTEPPAEALTVAVPLGPATLTFTNTALIVAVGPSRLILSADGLTLNAPRIDLNSDEYDAT